MALEQITDHAARAVARLVGQFKESPLLKGLVTAFGNEVQNAEDGVWALLAAFRDIDVAESAVLDSIAALVGAPVRGARTDTEYRARVRVQILANKSSGAASTIYAIAKALIPEWNVDDQPQIIEDSAGLPGYTIGYDPPFGVVNDTDLAIELGRVLEEANPAGVRGIVLSASIEPADQFTFDNGPGQGFGDGAFVGAYDGGVRT
jgi:hypothetical protein